VKFGVLRGLFGCLEGIMGDVRVCDEKMIEKVRSES
jgi:hypothetical protein